MSDQGVKCSPKYSVLNDLDYPVTIIGNDGELVFKNKAFEEIIKNEEQSISLDVNHPFFPEYRKRIAVSYHKAFSGEDSKCFAVMKSPDGKQLPVEIYLYPMKEKKENKFILAFFKKVDDRILSFDGEISTLSNSDHTITSNLLEFSPFPIIRFDNNLEIKFLSSSTEELCGKSRDVLLSKCDKFFSTLSLYDKEKLKKALNDVLGGNANFKRINDIKFEHDDKNIRWTNAFIYPIANNKNVSFVEVIFEDVTKVKMLEEKISLLHRMQVIGDLTKGLLHSFNNIINVIISKTQMLLQSTEKKSLVDGLNVINESAMDGAHQIRRVQDFVGDSEILDDEIKSNLIELVEDGIEFSKINFKVEQKEKGRDIRIQKQYYDNIQIFGNLRLLREIIVSMIFKVASNIGAEGIIDVEIKKEGDYCITVSTLRKYISESLDRPVESYMPEIEIRRTAEKINLRIIEEETPDLYLIKGVIPSKMIIEEENENEESTDFKIRDLDIMIIEDEPALQDILFELFNNMGNNVHVFSDSTEALEEIRKQNYDIVISDYGLAGITGVELLARVKELNDKAVTVLLTGWVISDITAYKNTIDLFMQKPFQIENLLIEISRIMKDKF